MEKEIEERLKRIEESIRFLAANHGKYMSRAGKNGSPDLSQEFIDNFWINKVDLILYPSKDMRSLT